jgi:hypothetical protein
MVQQSTSAWTVNRIVALVIGVVFLIIAILGLLLDTTGGYLLGFQVDLMHNIVHLLTGILGLWAAFGGWSRIFNRVFGIIYLLVGIAGLIPALYIGGKLLGMMAVNGADNVLHLVVGIVAALVGFFVRDTIGGYSGRTGTPDTMARP